MKRKSRYFMATLYVLAGLNHFLHPAFYRPMIPPYLPMPELLNCLAGAAEMFLGLALYFRRVSPWAAWGIVTLLIAVFPANLYMYENGGAGYHVPEWILFARLPFQLVLILWAYWYTWENSPYLKKPAPK